MKKANRHQEISKWGEEDPTIDTQDSVAAASTLKEEGMARKGRYELKTHNGYLLDEVVSALQKCVRRGLEEEALFWSLEMADSGYGQYLWKRLLVIAAEDVGLADPEALTLTVSGWLSTKECTKSFTQPPGMKTEFLGMVILYLSRAPKNREGDDAICYLLARRQKGLRLQVPDWALDQHTERGRKMGRGEEFWWEQSSLLDKPVVIEGDKYKAKLAAMTTGKLPMGEA